VGMDEVYGLLYSINKNLICEILYSCKKNEYIILGIDNIL